jgi:hypothetical protein
MASSSIDIPSKGFLTVILPPLNKLSLPPMAGCARRRPKAHTGNIFENRYKFLAPL